MLYRLALHCALPEGIKPSSHWGALLHGFLMKRLPSSMGDFFHDERTRPFAQHVAIHENGTISWRFGIWDEKAANAILSAVATLDALLVYEDQRWLSLPVLRMDHSRETEAAFCERYYANDVPASRYEMRFITPTTHKSDGVYASLPTPKFIYRSAALRFSTFSTEYDLYDPKTLRRLAEQTQIVRQAIQPTHYQMKSVTIPAYIGYISLSISGGDGAKRLAGMLLGLGELTCIGIKTAMGMGGCRVYRVR